jgi:uncharacterized protein
VEEAGFKFIADENVGKLARWMRLLGFDTSFFEGNHDAQMVNLALAEHRIILTRDTHVIERKPIARGYVQALLLKTDNVFEQTRIVMAELKLKPWVKLFTRCVECNLLLAQISCEAVKERVPSYVWQTQNEFVECPKCHRIYWKGTHWQAMRQSLTQMKIIGDE